jgi:truncated hemoglobin YjbI
VHFEPKAKVGAEADATTLYARLGGDAAVEATVDIFYNRVRNPMHATG